MSKKVLVTRNLPNFKELTQNSPIKWDINDSIKPKELLEVIDDYDGLICTLEDKIASETLKSAPRLKVVANYAVGFNNIDLEICSKNKIYVTNTPDVLTSATADLAITLLLAAARCIKPAYKAATNGDWKGWEPSLYLGQELQGKTLGVLGLGRIGEKFAQRVSSAWDMNLIYHNRNRNHEAEKSLGAKMVSLQNLAEEADFLSLHCPLTKETENIINKPFLQNMKKNSVLVNTARGEIINQDALFETLSEKGIFAAGLDVTTPEPLPPSHKLFRLNNVIITPHIGSATQMARTKMTEICINSVSEVLFGKEPKHWVNRDFNVA